MIKKLIFLIFASGCDDVYSKSFCSKEQIELVNSFHERCIRANEKSESPDHIRSYSNNCMENAIKLFCTEKNPVYVVVDPTYTHGDDKCLQIIK